MQSGPSKEELSNYFKNSRQYFDELAKHYKESDPAYYKEFIETFYTNPFYSYDSQQKKGCKAGIIIIFFVAIMIAGLTIAVLFILRNDKPTDNDIEKYKEKIIDSLDSDEIQLEKLDSILINKELNKKDRERIRKQQKEHQDELNKKNKNRTKPKERYN